MLLWDWNSKILIGSNRDFNDFVIELCLNLKNFIFGLLNGQKSELGKLVRLMLFMLLN